MKCKKEEAVLDYLFGEMPAGERAEMKAHFAGCAGCRRRLEALKGIKAAAASALEPSPAPENFTERLMRRLAAEEPASAAGVFHNLFRPAYALAFAALALCVLFGVRELKEKAASPYAPPRAIYLTDGPAVPGKHLGPALSFKENGGGKPEAEKIITDACLTANCGLL